MNACMKNFLGGYSGLVLVSSLLTAAGCATPGDGRPDAAEPGKFPSVTFHGEASTLGATVRRLGEECGGGLVLMNGLEERPVGPVKLHRNDYEFLVRRLTQETGLVAHATAYYYFLHPPEYEVLRSINVEGVLAPRYAEPRTSISFGNGTRLYNVFGVLSRNLGITVVADNVVAETPCGEFFLTDAPLPAVLNAILQSARLSPQAFAIESTDEYIFIRSMANRNPSGALLNAEALTPDQQQLLARRVYVELPRQPDTAEQVLVYQAALTLEATLPALSAQLGCPVRVAPGLEDLPVNFAVMTHVRVATVMDLIVRQWPIAEFGYEVVGTEIRIRRR